MGDLRALQEAAAQEQEARRQELMQLRREIDLEQAERREQTTKLRAEFTRFLEAKLEALMAEVALLEENAAAETVTVAASLEEKEVAATDHESARPDQRELVRRA